MSNEIVSKRIRRTYGQREIQRGLIALAYANGNAAKAHRDLAEDDLDIPERTLNFWAIDQHKDEYERVRREVLPIVGAQTADEHMALARKQMAVSNKLADELARETHKLDPRDKATAMRNLDVGSGIHTGNARDLQGDYATPHKSQDTKALLRKFYSLIGAETPEELDAEVIAESDA